MSGALARVSLPGLLGIARDLREGRLQLPCRGPQLRGHTSPGEEEAVAAQLSQFCEAGQVSAAVALLIECLASERRDVQAGEDAVDLVWSGPEGPGSVNRDTAVVVRELFEQAERSVLISTFVLDGGEKVRGILGSLAQRLDRGDPLDVRLFVNVPRRKKDSRPEGEVVADFARHFRDEVWPGRKLPAVWYDPRALVTRGPTRSSLHAKCIVVDDRLAFVTSANFTEAAHHRNVEAGVVVHSSSVARTLRAQFDALVAGGELRPVLGGSSCSELS